MKLLTAEQMENLEKYGDDPQIGNILQYSPAERTRITDARVKWALKKLISDKAGPFASTVALHEAATAIGMKCSLHAFDKRINPNYGGGFEARAAESPGAEISNNTGFFRSELFEFASMLLRDGFLTMGARAKHGMAMTTLWRQGDIDRDKILGALHAPDAQAQARANSKTPEALAKKGASMKETLRRKKEEKASADGDRRPQAKVHALPPSPVIPTGFGVYCR